MAHNEFLPGMKPKRIGSLIDACRRYLDVNDKLKLLKKQLEEAQDAVGVEMRKRKLADYSFGGVTCHLEEKEKVRIARAAEQPTERHFPGQEERNGDGVSVTYTSNGKSFLERHHMNGKKKDAAEKGPRRPRRTPAQIDQAPPA